MSSHIIIVVVRHHHHRRHHHRRHHHRRCHRYNVIIEFYKVYRGNKLITTQ